MKVEIGEVWQRKEFTIDIIEFYKIIESHAMINVSSFTKLVGISSWIYQELTNDLFSWKDRET